MLYNQGFCFMLQLDYTLIIHHHVQKVNTFLHFFRVFLKNKQKKQKNKQKKEKKQAKKRKIKSINI